jgi:hypothetical protein
LIRRAARLALCAAIHHSFLNVRPASPRRLNVLDPMTQLSGPATLQAIADARRSARRIERALARFVKHRQPAVLRLASQHPRLADLALSFPALLFALAVPRPGFDPSPVIAGVIAGDKLKTLAAAANVPLWTRRLVPEAFDSALPKLPCSDAFTREIGNFLPKPRIAVRWLICVAIVGDVADDGVALWKARHVANAKLPFTDEAVRRVALWAWFSQRPHAVAGQLVETRWTPHIGLAAARDAAWTWRECLALTAHLGLGVIEDVWLESAEVDGYLFEPLRSANDLVAEAKAMQNCSAGSGYGRSYQRNRTRLWRVTKEKIRVAMVETEICCKIGENAHPEICQIAGPANNPVPVELKRAVYLWWLQQPALRQPAQHGPKRYDHDIARSTWIALWRPYWLDKRTLPKWLPMSTASTALNDL